MQNNKLHIIALDIPDPPDYGGAIDMFYKIKNLAALGVKIYLHCYEYGRKHSAILEEWCKEVWYYPREAGIKSISLRVPYIVNSRKGEQLLQRLQAIDAPILFEGVHTTWFLSHPSLANRIKTIRNHNVEHEYYDQLYHKEDDFFRKIYFKVESRLLKKYELSLYDAQVFLSVSLADYHYFKNAYPDKKHAFLTPFHPYDEVNIKQGSGDYILYHGNLKHPENKEAALYLLKEVFPGIDFPIKIAGRNPPEEVIAACGKLPNCELIANPASDVMNDLIANAHIHILPTFQPTGLKLKLLYALFGGRHVLVNKGMVHGTALDDCCVIANDAQSFKGSITQLLTRPFTEMDIANRKAILEKHYNNKIKAKQLITYLQG